MSAVNKENKIPVYRVYTTISIGSRSLPHPERLIIPTGFVYILDVKQNYRTTSKEVYIGDRLDTSLYYIDKSAVMKDGKWYNRTIPEHASEIDKIVRLANKSRDRFDYLVDSQNYILPQPEIITETKIEPAISWLFDYRLHFLLSLPQTFVIIFALIAALKVFGVIQ